MDCVSIHAPRARGDAARAEAEKAEAEKASEPSIVDEILSYLFAA